MIPHLFDIHCHLNSPEFENDWREVLDRTLAENCWLVNVGVDLLTSKKAIEISETKETGVWATVGFHPTEKMTAEDWSEIIELAKNSKVVAIGECGLEYYERMMGDELQMTNQKKEEQKKIFRQHIELALELNKPLMIHCRPAQGTMDAYEEAIEILNEYKQEVGGKLRGDFHFFAGDWVVAQKCLNLGFTLSFTGVITFTHDYEEVIKKAPIELIMAETDSPYASPVPYRGKRCEPLYVSEVVRKLAELRDLTCEEMTQIVVQNAKKLFGV